MFIWESLCQLFFLLTEFLFGLGGSVCLVDWSLITGVLGQRHHALP